MLIELLSFGIAMGVILGLMLGLRKILIIEKRITHMLQKIEKIDMKIEKELKCILQKNKKSKRKTKKK